MNPIIKRELEKVRAPLPEYDDSTTLIKILREVPQVTPKLTQGKSYLVSLEDYILHEPPNFNLSSNWNAGIVPISKYMTLTVTRVMGKMVQVNAQGYNWEQQISNPDVYTNIWLPGVSVTILKEL